MTRFRDVVILLPGITGSVLVDADGQEVWSPTVGAIWRAVTQGAISKLALAPSGGANGVTAPSLIPDVTIVPGLIKIDGYSGIERYLIEELGLVRNQNYFPFPYDWRRDNRESAQHLKVQAASWLESWRKSQGAHDAKLVLIGHSMGGLVARYFLECLDGWKTTRSLITLGTPHRGSLNAVDFIIHGMKKGIGPFGLDLTPLLRSFPSVYQLLPTYPCVAVGSNPLARVSEIALPFLDAARVLDAKAFHDEIIHAQQRNATDPAYRDSGYVQFPLVGIEQPTYQSARLASGKVELLRTYEDRDDGGDGTVPRVSATPLELSAANREIYAAEIHGSLQNGAGPLANLKGLLTRPDLDLSRFRRDEGTTLTLDVDDVVLHGDPLKVRARPSQGSPIISVTITDADTGESVPGQLRRADAGWQEAEFDLSPGTWRVRVQTPEATPVTDLAVVVSPP